MSAFGGAFTGAGHAAAVTMRKGGRYRHTDQESSTANCGEDSSVEDLLSQGFTFRGTLGHETPGGGDGATGGPGKQWLCDFRNEIMEPACDGGRAATWLRHTGTHTGLLLGLPATQRRVDMRARFSSRR